MKKHLLFLCLATACTRASEPTERPRPLSNEHHTFGSDSTTELLPVADSIGNGPTPQEREDYRRIMAQQSRSMAGQPVYTARDSAYTVIALTNRQAFVGRVNECLDHGYYLRGPLRTERTGPGSFVYLQDLVCHRARVQD